MGFWDKLEKALDKVAESAENFEKKANTFLDKALADAPKTKTAFTPQELLAMTKKNIKKIASARLLSGLQELNSTTTKIYYSDLEKDSGGINIATATIEKIEPRYTNLSDIQYRIILKGLINGEDDYGQTSVFGKYDIELIIDQYTEFSIEKVRVTHCR